MIQKKLNILIIGFIIISLLFSGCISDSDTDSKQDSQENNKTENNTDEPEIYLIHLYPNAVQAAYCPDSFWDEMNFHSGLENTLYFSDDSVEEIIDWYDNSSNIGNWTIKESGKMGGDEQDPSLVTFGYAKLKQDDHGLYIIASIAKETFVSANTIIGIGEGTWEQVNNSGEEEKDTETSYEFGYYEELGDGTIEFDRIILDDNAYTAINPLGALDPSAGHTFPTDHGAFWLTHPQGYSTKDNVYAPADGIITRITYHKNSNYDDYKIIIAHTNTFYSYLGHISELDNSIIDKAGTISEGETNFENPIEITKGQIIGKTGGTGGAEMSMYWGILDQDITLGYANTNRYNNYKHASHFINYCSDNIKTDLLIKLGSGEPYNYKRTTEPLCGEVDYYKYHQDTLVGNWFHISIDENDPMAEFTKHLSFVYDMWNPSDIKIGIGGILDATNTVYAVVGNTPNPKDIKTGDQAIFKLQGTEEFSETSITATLLVEMLDTETIKVQAFTGHQTNPEFTSSAATYIR